MSSSSRRAVIGSIAVSIAFVMELTLVPLLLPAIQAEFALSIGQLAWVFNSYGMAVAAGVLFGGFLGDIFKTHRVFSIGVILFATGSAVVATAGTFEMIIAGRVMQGFGGGVFSPLIPLLLTRSAPERPGKVLIVWGSVAGYVAAFAPFFYGTMLEAPDWHMAFIAFAVVSVLALIIVNTASNHNEPDAPKVSLSTYRKLLQTPGLWVMYVYIFCTYGAITFYLFGVPLWLAGNDYQVANIGLTLSVMWLSFSVISTLMRNWVDRPRLRKILMTAPILIAAGFLVAYLSPSLSSLLVASLLIGAGLACSNAPSTQIILRFAPKGTGALSASLDITFARLGGVATVAFLAQAQIGFTALAVWTMSLVALGCAVATARRLRANT